MRKIVTVIILGIALFQSGNLCAQDLLKSTDLSALKVDYMSDGDIAKIKECIANGNMATSSVHILIKR